MLSVISLNALLLFLDSFPDIHARAGLGLAVLDVFCVLFFVLEAWLKITGAGFASYWRDSWNKFDFVILALSLPSLLTIFDAPHTVGAFLILRLGRLLRLFRAFKFIPDADKIYAGIGRALKASFGVFLALFLLNFVFAVVATMIFGEMVPQYFGNPIRSSFALFHAFTVEGWNEIPSILEASSETRNIAIFVRLYFMFVLLTGGVLGLSLANAVFVDEMTSDNTAAVEQMVSELRSDIETLRRENSLLVSAVKSEVLTELRSLLAEKSEGKKE